MKEAPSKQVPTMKWHFRPILAKTYTLAGIFFSIASALSIMRFGISSFPGWSFLIGAIAFLFLGFFYRRVIYVTITEEFIDIRNAYNLSTSFPRSGLVVDFDGKKSLIVCRGKQKVTIASSLVGEKALKEIAEILASRK